MEENKVVEMNQKEPAKVKSLAEMNQEYANLCAMTGDRQYRIELMKAETAAMQGQMHTLVQEIKKAESEKPAEGQKA